MQLNQQQVLLALRYKDARNPTEAEQGIRRRWLEIYPDQEANVLSYQDNPACKCAGEMMNAMAKDQHARLKANISYIFGEPVELVIPRSIFGEVFIADSDEAYKQIVMENQRLGNFFRGVSVVPDTAAGKPILKIYYW